jgi:hypothetical protein
MTKETLAQIISDHFESAKRGDIHAIGVVATAQAELKKIEKIDNDIAFGQIIAKEINWEKNLA